jgi:hypothetical protein
VEAAVSDLLVDAGGFLHAAPAVTVATVKSTVNSLFKTPILKENPLGCACTGFETL